MAVTTEETREKNVSRERTKSYLILESEFFGVSAIEILNSAIFNEQTG